MDVNINKLPDATLSVLKGKFAKTIATLEGVWKEAKGDMETKTEYSAKAVFGRVDQIKEKFYAEVAQLATDIEQSNK